MAIYCIVEINNYLPTGKCKIGYGERPFKRTSELQTGNSPY